MLLSCRELPGKITQSPGGDLTAGQPFHNMLRCYNVWRFHYERRRHFLGGPMGEDIGGDIGDELLASGAITAEQLATAREMQNSIGGDIAPILTKLRYLTEQDMLERVAQRSGLRSLSRDEIELSGELMLTFEPEFLDKHEVLPIKMEGTTLTLAMADPQNVGVIDEVRFKTGYNVEAVLMSRRDIQRALNDYFHQSGDSDRLRVFGTDKRRLAREILEEGLHAPAKPAKPDEPAVSENIGAPEANDLDSLGVPPARIMKALASLMIEKDLISFEELQAKLADLNE